MFYIVMDLEWNQCPYGKKKEDPDLPFEVIEIGAVKLDDSFREVGTFHETIRPVRYKKLHYMTRSVIHMTEQDFEGKRVFPQVFADFLTWCGSDCMMCTWGPGDLTEFQRNVRWHMNRGNLQGKWPFPFPLFYRDVQKIFSYVHENGKARRSLEWAVEYLGLPKDEAFHDAFSDARYTAGILKLLPPSAVKKYSSVDTYVTPKKRSEEILIRYSSYTKFISKSFPDRDEVMKDREVRATLCNVCGRKIPRKIHWFSDNGRNYLCAASCPEHGLIKGKARVRQNADGEWFVIKTTRQITDEEYEKVKERRETLRVRRKLHRSS